MLLAYFLQRTTECAILFFIHDAYGLSFWVSVAMADFTAIAFDYLAVCPIYTNHPVYKKAKTMLFPV